METIRREQLAGIARIYADNRAASRALGPAFRAFIQALPPLRRTAAPGRRTAAPAGALIPL